MSLGLWGVLCGPLAGVALAAGELEQAREHFRTGTYAAALDAVGAWLVAHPDDAEGQFLKGVILTQMGRQEDAIGTFEALTLAEPSFPEPYNNLAVLYASRGRAREAARVLETAVRLNPDYVTGWQNLGDIYFKLASDAYQTYYSLQGGAGDPRPRQGRAPAGTPGLQVAVEIRPAGTAGGEAPTSGSQDEDASGTPAQPRRESGGDAVPAVEPAPSAAPVAMADAGAPPAEHAGPPTEEAGGNDGDSVSQVRRAVQDWARAWRDKDMERYLAAYAATFEPDGGLGRADWERQRQQRIGDRAAGIELVVDDLSVEITGPTEAQVRFRQDYRSDGFHSVVRKTLRLHRYPDGWKIVAERVGG